MDRANPSYSWDPVALEACDEAILDVPSLLHFVWCGAEPLTEEFRANARDWRREIDQAVLWTDQEFPSAELIEFCRDSDIRLLFIGDVLGSDSPISSYFSHLTDGLFYNYGGASDLIRNEMLDRFGGVYVDFDVPMREEYREALNFSEQRGTYSAVSTGNDLQMSCPGHPIFKRIREEILDRMGKELRKNEWEFFHTVIATGPDALRASESLFEEGDGYTLRSLPETKCSRSSWFRQYKFDSVGPAEMQKLVTQCLVKLAQSPERPDWEHLFYCVDGEVAWVSEVALRYLGDYFPDVLSNVQEIRNYRGPSDMGFLMTLGSIPRAVVCLSADTPQGAIESLVPSDWSNAQYQQGIFPPPAIMTLYEKVDQTTRLVWDGIDPSLRYFKDPSQIPANNPYLKLLGEHLDESVRLDETNMIELRMWDFSAWQKQQTGLARWKCRHREPSEVANAMARYNALAETNGWRLIDIGRDRRFMVDNPRALLHYLSSVESKARFADSLRLETKIDRVVCACVCVFSGLLWVTLYASLGPGFVDE